MAFRGIDSARLHEYVSERDPDPDNPTKWLLKCPSRRVVTYLSDKHGVTVTGQVGTVVGMMYDYVRVGLAGFHNFLDANGGPVEFKTVREVMGGAPVSVVHPEIMDMLDSATISELASEIIELTNGSEDERGKSAG